MPFPASTGSLPLLRVLMCCCVLSLFPAAHDAGRLQASDESVWPQFRGPLGDGVVPTTTVPTTWAEDANIAWKTPLEGEGHSSPIIVGDQIWLSTALIEELSAEEAAERLAKYKNPKQLEIAGKLTLCAICVDVETGRVIDQITLFEIEEPEPKHALNSFASPTPVYANGKVFFHFGAYGTCALDAVSRNILWTSTRAKVDHQNGPGSSPLAYDDLLIVHYDGIDKQFVVAYDQNTGSYRWLRDRSQKLPDAEDQKKAYGTPIVVNQNGTDVVVSTGADWVYGYDAKTGRELWYISYGELGFSTVPRPIVGDGLAYICTSFPKSKLLAIRVDTPGTGNLTDSHVAWSNKSQMPQKPSLLYWEDRLYAVSDGGVVSCLKAATGEEVYRQRTDHGGNYSASPLLIGEHIYLFSQDGVTTVIKPGDEYAQVAENVLDGEIMATPAVYQDALILRTSKAMYRIQKQKRTAGLDSPATN